MHERLQKILARAGCASRRRAEELIRQGRVTVDGRVVREMGAKADPQRQRIVVDGRPLGLAEEKVYLLLNKPKGYVTTLHDPQGRPMIRSLLQGVPQRVFPVGRLDIDTEGALLLTNDGELANRVLHPRYQVRKTYRAVVKGRPAARHLRRLAEGVLLEGRKTAPARIRVRKVGPDATTLEVTIHEGRKRQVRKMFALLGYPVQSLTRLAYGQLRLGNLAKGRYRFLTRQEVTRIFAGSRLEKPDSSKARGPGGR